MILPGDRELGRKFSLENRFGVSRVRVHSSQLRTPRGNSFVSAGVTYGTLLTLRPLGNTGVPFFFSSKERDTGV